MQNNKNRDNTEISLVLYGGECEISSYRKGEGAELAFVFDESVNGYITIDNLVTTVNAGHGRFDSRLLSRGDYTPRLISDGRIIELPRLRKTDKSIRLQPPDDAYIRSISMRERELEMKVSSLEDIVNGLRDSVYGKTIF